MDSPIFIIGSPRSGTTLLRLMLTCHRSIVIPPECGFIIWLYEEFKSWSVTNLTKSNSLKHFINKLLECRKIETWHLEEENLIKYIISNRPHSYSDLVSCIYEFYGLSKWNSFNRWGDKNNFYINHIITLKEIFPDAFFVHLVRDGRDVACSYKNLIHKKDESKYAPNLTKKIDEIAEAWKSDIQTINDSFLSIGWNNVIEVKYECLVSKPENTLRNLTQKICVDYDPSMLHYYKLNKELELEPKEFIKWKEKNLKPLIKEEIGRYKSELTDNEMLVLEEIAKNQLVYYGYVV